MPAEAGAGTVRARGSAGLWLLDRAALLTKLQDEERRTPRLSADELARAEIKAAADAGAADLWRAGRVALRLVLEQAGVAARRVPFVTDAHGRPALPDTALSGSGLSGSGMQFSTSDSGPWLLIGISSYGPVGVDIEAPRSLRMSADRVARVLTAARCLSPQTPGSPEFLQAWTRIEAFAKARGPSLAQVLTDLGVIGLAAGDATAANIAERSTSMLRNSHLTVHDVAVHGLAAACCLSADACRPVLHIADDMTDITGGTVNRLPSPAARPRQYG